MSSPWKSRWLWIPLAGLLAALALFDGGLFEQREYHARLDSLRALEQELEEENAFLREDVSRLRANDPDRLEQEARAQGMIRPGERVYLLATEADSLEGLKTEQDPTEGAAE